MWGSSHMNLCEDGGRDTCHSRRKSQGAEERGECGGKGKHLAWFGLGKEGGFIQAEEMNRGRGELVEQGEGEMVNKRLGTWNGGTAMVPGQPKLTESCCKGETSGCNG
jgi:hypothetical protein